MKFIENTASRPNFPSTHVKTAITLRMGASGEARIVPYLREWVKLELRAIWHRKQTRLWLQLLNSQPAFWDFVRHYPRLLYKIYRPYLTNTLSIESRLALLESHYQIIFKRGLDSIVTQASRASLIMGQVEGKTGTHYELRLHAIGTLEREGELVLQLVEKEGPVICSIAFTFADFKEYRAVCVGCIQGPKSESALAAIRRATREMHGLRPKHLMVILVRHIGSAIGCSELRLVSNANRVVRGAMRQGRVKADYDELWRELGAHRRTDGDYVLTCEPLRVPDMESIPSKKRSEARRRYEMSTTLVYELMGRLSIVS